MEGVRGAVVGGANDVLVVVVVVVDGAIGVAVVIGGVVGVVVEVTDVVADVIADVVADAVVADAVADAVDCVLIAVGCVVLVGGNEAGVVVLRVGTMVLPLLASLVVGVVFELMLVVL